MIERFRRRFAAPACALAALITAPCWIVVNDAIGRRAFYLAIDQQDVVALVALSLLICVFAWWILGAQPNSSVGRVGAGVGITVLIGMTGFAAIAIERNADPTNWVSFDVLKAIYGGAVLVCLGLVIPEKTPRAARVAMAVLTLLSPVYLAFLLIGARALATLPGVDVTTMPTVAPAGAPRPGRVVFLLYDELDPAYVFGAGRSGRVFPAFERLRRESRSYTQAQPPVNVLATHLAVPTLLTGKQVSDFDPTDRADAIIKFQDGTQASWATTRTILTDAAHAGFRIGIAGWYFPYCRFAAAARANACAWQSITPFRSFGEGSFHFSQSTYEWVRRLVPFARRASHVTMVQQVGEAAMRIASDPAIDIAFVHLPIPHFPYFFNSASRTYGLAMTTYEDNVVGADDYLASMRNRMERAGVWDVTTFVVTSDHPFRGGHGNAALAAGAGEFVPLLIHSPGVAPTELACVSSAQSAVLFATLIRQAGDLASMSAAIDQWQKPSDETKCSLE